MYWSRPVTTGDQPPAVRAHSFTAVGIKLYLFGGGDGNKIYNDLYICDTGPPPPFGHLFSFCSFFFFLRFMSQSR